MGDISPLVRSPILSIGSECTVSEAILLFHTQRVDALFIEKSDRFVGMVVKSDLIGRINRGDLFPETALIVDAMEQPIPCLDCRCPLKEASDFMGAHQIRYVAVTEDRQIIGILSLKDVIAHSMKS